MGRMLTHKDLVVRLHLQGYSVMEISCKTYHSPRSVDAYQAGIISLDELQSRSGPLLQRISQLTEEEAILAAEFAANKEKSLLLSNLEAFCRKVNGTINQLSFTERQHLIRMVVEKVVVRDWTVKIFLRIPIQQGPTHDPDDRFASPVVTVSSDSGLRSNREPEGR